MPMINGVGFSTGCGTSPSTRYAGDIVTGESWLTDEVREELRVLGAEVRLKPIGLDDLLAWTRRLVAGCPSRPAAAAHTQH